MMLSIRRQRSRHPAQPPECPAWRRGTSVSVSVLVEIRADQPGVRGTYVCSDAHLCLPMPAAPPGTAPQEPTSSSNPRPIPLPPLLVAPCHPRCPVNPPTRRVFRLLSQAFSHAHSPPPLPPFRNFLNETLCSCSSPCRHWSIARLFLLGAAPHTLKISHPFRRASRCPVDVRGPSLTPAILGDGHKTCTAARHFLVPPPAQARRGETRHALPLHERDQTALHLLEHTQHPRSASSWHAEE
jgi:hypothetical protein